MRGQIGNRGQKSVFPLIITLQKRSENTFKLFCSMDPFRLWFHFLNLANRRTEHDSL